MIDRRFHAKEGAELRIFAGDVTIQVVWSGEQAAPLQLGKPRYQVAPHAPIVTVGVQVNEIERFIREVHWCVLSFCPVGAPPTINFGQVLCRGQLLFVAVWADSASLGVPVAVARPPSVEQIQPLSLPIGKQRPSVFSVGHPNYDSITV